RPRRFRSPASICACSTRTAPKRCSSFRSGRGADAGRVGRDHGPPAADSSSVAERRELHRQPTDARLGAALLQAGAPDLRVSEVPDVGQRPARWVHGSALMNLKDPALIEERIILRKATTWLMLVLKQPSPDGLDAGPRP